MYLHMLHPAVKLGRRACTVHVHWYTHQTTCTSNTVIACSRCHWLGVQCTEHSERYVYFQNSGQCPRHVVVPAPKSGFDLSTDHNYVHIRDILVDYRIKMQHCSVIILIRASQWFSGLTESCRAQEDSLMQQVHAH